MHVVHCDTAYWQVERERGKMVYDKIIIGAGLYGLYAALFCCRKGQSVLVLVTDREPYKRASCMRQAGVRRG